MRAVVLRFKDRVVDRGGKISASEAKKGKARQWLAFISREPFFQFIFLGSLIWSGVEYWSVQRDRYTIHIGPAQRQRIATAYVQQFGQSPTPDQLRRLVDQYVRGEIFLREGIALGLDKNDEIVRRRIVQKFEFLQTDLASVESPAPAELRSWFEQNKSRYLTPERVTFSHIYFSVDQGGGDKLARERAIKVLERLRASHALRAPGLGDPFPGPSDVSDLAQTDAVKLFGESELSMRLYALPANEWEGPYRSGYGWHLVYVTGRAAPTLPPLAEIEQRVVSDYMDEKRRLFGAREYQALRAKYTLNYGADGG